MSLFNYRKDGRDRLGGGELQHLDPQTVEGRPAGVELHRAGDPTQGGLQHLQRSLLIRDAHGSTLQRRAQPRAGAVWPDLIFS